MADTFSACWDVSKGRFKDLGLDKVLHEMRRHEIPAAERKAKVLPLSNQKRRDRKQLAARPSGAVFTKIDSVMRFSSEKCAQRVARRLKLTDGRCKTSQWQRLSGGVRSRVELLFKSLGYQLPFSSRVRDAFDGSSLIALLLTLSHLFLHTVIGRRPDAHLRAACSKRPPSR